MDKRCLKHDLDIAIDTWKYLFYFKLSQNIFVPWVYVKIKQCASLSTRHPPPPCLHCSAFQVPPSLSPSADVLYEWSLTEGRANDARTFRVTL